jgi:hypothetical protein
MRTVIGILLLLAAHPLCASELTVNQQLVLACYRLDVGQVVNCLRQGADVNARFRASDRVIGDFSDRWTGGFPMAADSWTPLIALASSREYPDPPAELGEIWKDPVRSAMIQKRIPREQIERRRKRAMVILYILLSHKCNLEDDDGYGATALFEAVDSGKVAMAKTLLDFGANPNVKVRAYIDGASDRSPLHVASHSRELVQLLLDHGADANATDSEGHTPADWIALDLDRTFDLVKTSKGWRIRPRAVRENASDDPFAR